ncbi:hypothetical protein ACP4OV_009029 [Aristida adscensionis]
MERIKFAFRSDESDPMPLPIECHPQNVMINIAKGNKALTVYRNLIPSLGCHYAGIRYEGSIQYCIARLFENVDEAIRIYGQLVRCEHPNIFQPLDIWVCEDKVKWCEQEEISEMEKIFKACISFPLIDGALTDVPKEEIFLVEKDGTQSVAYGFTSQGSTIFCDLFSAVDHINGMYEEAADTTICSLKLDSKRILYNKVAEGEYRVFIWLDFYSNEEEKMKYKKVPGGKPTIDDMRSANWANIATYIRSIWKSFKVTPNEELKQLSILLSRKLPKGVKYQRYDDLLWHPGLWTIHTKIHFIRDVFWYFDGIKDNEDILKSKNSLGLSAVISKLGFRNRDYNLYDSIMFLRKKVVAHQDSSYQTYKGHKDDVGIDKTTIGIFLQKAAPNCIIQLVKEIRQLNWIERSPLTASETLYVKPSK